MRRESRGPENVNYFKRDKPTPEKNKSFEVKECKRDTEMGICKLSRVSANGWIQHIK